MEFRARLGSQADITQRFDRQYATMQRLRQQLTHHVCEVTDALQSRGLVPPVGDSFTEANPLQAFLHEYGNLATQTTGFLTCLGHARDTIRERAFKMKDPLIAALRHRPAYLTRLDDEIERIATQHMPDDVKNRLHSVIGDIERVCADLAEELAQLPPLPRPQQARA